MTNSIEPTNSRSPKQRDTSDPLVRAAIENVRANLAALPANEIIQLLLFPDTIVSWAQKVGESECMVSNLCRHHRRYKRLRQVMADHFEVPLLILSHLIDATPSKPVAERLPERAAVLEAAGLSSWAHQSTIDFSTPPYPAYRDGNNPLERLALHRMENEAPAMPATRIISYALFPDNLSRWATQMDRRLDNVLSTLGNGVRNPKIERSLARRLGVSMQVLDQFIISEKREPQATLPASQALVPELGAA